MNQNYLNTYYSPNYVYSEIRNYFDLDEFYRNEVIDWAKTRFKGLWEERLWSYLEFRMLSNLLFIRVNLNKPITINHGATQQRGFRDILCNIVRNKWKKLKLYLSAHVRGSGVDFDVSGMIAEDVRNWIESKSEEIPYKLRLEWKKRDHNRIYQPITWVHMDSNYEPNHPKVYKFNI
jgi:hypothetical protein